MKIKESLLVIDATWLTRRNFHAIGKCFKTEKIVNDNGDEEETKVQDDNLLVISTLQSVLKLIKDYQYEYRVVLCFDRGTYRYRDKKKFTEYKSNREYDETYECCWSGTNKLIELSRSIGLTVVQVPGCEADDLGYYFSNNSENCILYSYDSDWRQSITKTTLLNNSKQVFSYEDLIKDHITEPFDFAIEKAIIGSHDNLKSVNLQPTLDNLFDSSILIGDAIIGYKNRTLPQSMNDDIDYNLNLSRLDRILDDKEVHNMIQEQFTKVYINQISMISSLAKLPNYPKYFLGVLNKYNKLRNS